MPKHFAQVKAARKHADEIDPLASCDVKKRFPNCHTAAVICTMAAKHRFELIFIQQRSISSTFNEQFLRAQIPKKDIDELTVVLFALILKVARKYVGEIDPLGRAN